MYNVYMITRRRTFYLGIFIFLIPFLGLPTTWKTTLIIFSALLLIIFSVSFSLPKKQVKPRVRRKEKTPQAFTDIAPPQTSENVDSGPETLPPSEMS